MTTTTKLTTKLLITTNDTGVFEDVQLTTGGSPIPARRCRFCGLIVIASAPWPAHECSLPAGVTVAERSKGGAWEGTPEGAGTFKPRR